MKHNLALLLVVLGAFLIVIPVVDVVRAITQERGPDPVALTLGIVGGVLVWRGLLLRFPQGLRSREIQPRLGEEWTTKTGTPKPSFLSDRASGSPPEPS